MVKYVVIDKFMKMLDINSYQRDVSISQVFLLTNVTPHGSDKVCEVFENWGLSHLFALINIFQKF